jgi:hypothetical protein
MSADYDWSDDEIVIHSQPRTAVYTNPHGQIVIRQDVGWPDEDHFVYFSIRC